VIHDFAKEHPQFRASFPYEHLYAVKFDHASHFGKHFSEPGMADRVPAGGCVGCHTVGEGSSAIRPAGFETTCARCHSDGIAKRDFVFFRWPEIDTNDFKQEEVLRACNLPAQVQADNPNWVKGMLRDTDTKPAAFSGVSADPLNALSAYLLDVPADDSGSYDKPVQDFARALISRGADPFIAAVQKQLQLKSVDPLFVGFNAEQARQAACSWAANKEYEAPGKAALPGWRVDALSLNYTRPSHADRVVKAWLEAVAAMPLPDNPDQRARLKAARSELLSASEGPGECMKCHTVSGPADGPMTINWRVQLHTDAPLTRFDHRPHLDLLGPEKTCTSCHQLGDGTGPTANVGLKPIALSTCTACHAAGKVRDDCKTCHVYHQNEALKKRMIRDVQ